MPESITLISYFTRNRVVVFVHTIAAIEENTNEGFSSLFLIGGNEALVVKENAATIYNMMNEAVGE